MGYSTKMDAELEYRRQLLEAARKGKIAAQQELQEEYGVRIYTAAERAAITCDTSALRMRRLVELPPIDVERYDS